MMNAQSERMGWRVFAYGRVIAGMLLIATGVGAQRLTGTENGEWRYLGGTPVTLGLLH